MTRHVSVIVPYIKKGFDILQSSRQLSKLHNERKTMRVFNLNLKVRLFFNSLDVSDCSKSHIVAAPLNFSSQKPSSSTHSIRVPRIFRFGHNHITLPVRIFPVSLVEATSKVILTRLSVKGWTKFGNNPLKSQTVIRF